MLLSHLKIIRPLAMRFYSKEDYNFGLTPSEIADLRENWRVVDDAPIPVAKLFFKNLFDKNPDYQKKFPMYNHKTMLTHTNAFIPHMRAVVTSINKIITRLGDEKTISQVMNYIATAHAKRGIGRTELEQMGVSIKETLKILNKDTFTPGAERAFEKFWVNFLDNYMERYHKLRVDQKK